MDVDGEQGGAAVQDLPCRREGLAARRPRLVPGVDQAGVVPQLGPGQHLVGGRRVAWAGVLQPEHVGLVQVRDADVAARRAAVLVVDRVDVGEVVGRAAAETLDSLREGGQGLGRVDGAVVGLAVVVLDLLHGD